MSLMRAHFFVDWWLKTNWQGFLVSSHGDEDTEMCNFAMMREHVKTMNKFYK